MTTINGKKMFSINIVDGLIKIENIEDVTESFFAELSQLVNLSRLVNESN